MKTTLVINDTIMRRLKREAARRDSTMSELVEVALRRMLDDKVPPVELPDLPSFDGGGTRVDVADRDALYQAMEGR
ncbi:MAG: ribbon-helix-helix protein, CopG family [Myxococcota bacterium]